MFLKILESLEFTVKILELVISHKIFLSVLYAFTILFCKALQIKILAISCVLVARRWVLKYILFLPDVIVYFRYFIGDILTDTWLLTWPDGFISKWWPDYIIFVMWLCTQTSLNMKIFHNICKNTEEIEKILWISLSYSFNEDYWESIVHPDCLAIHNPIFIE